MAVECLHALLWTKLLSVRCMMGLATVKVYVSRVLLDHVWRYRATAVLVWSYLTLSLKVVGSGSLALQLPGLLMLAIVHWLVRRLYFLLVLELRHVQYCYWWLSFACFVH